jgi:branched-chain amino acid aminotransferase
MTGTAAEVTPIRSVDQIVIGSGSKGEITNKLQKRFFDIVDGSADDIYNWMTFVNDKL